MIDINSINNLQSKVPENFNNNKAEAATNVNTQVNNDESQQSAQDSVQVSDTAQSLQKITQELADLPVVDTDRVEAIRQALDENTYSVSSEKAAEKILLLENRDA